MYMKLKLLLDQAGIRVAVSMSESPGLAFVIDLYYGIIQRLIALAARMA